MIKKICHDESNECLALMKWARLIKLDNGLMLSDALYHIPNGGKRNATEAGIMNGEGVKAGMPDYHLPMASRTDNHIGLYIEMKKPTAIPSAVKLVQRTRAIALRKCDNSVQFARTWEVAAFKICEYLAIKHNFTMPKDEAIWETNVNRLIQEAIA